MAEKRKPVAGHKRDRVTFSVSVTCECGWTSAQWAGKGASKQAHNEWRWHIDQCSKPDADVVSLMKRLDLATDPTLITALERYVARRLELLPATVKAATLAEGERLKIWPY